MGPSKRERDMKQSTLGAPNRWVSVDPGNPSYKWVSFGPERSSGSNGGTGQISISQANAAAAANASASAAGSGPATNTGTRISFGNKSPRENAGKKNDTSGDSVASEGSSGAESAVRKTTRTNETNASREQRSSLANLMNPAQSNTTDMNSSKLVPSSPSPGDLHSILNMSSTSPRENRRFRFLADNSLPPLPPGPAGVGSLPGFSRLNTANSTSAEHDDRPPTSGAFHFDDARSSSPQKPMFASAVGSDYQQQSNTLSLWLPLDPGKPAGPTNPVIQWVPAQPVSPRPSNDQTGTRDH